MESWQSSKRETKREVGKDKGWSQEESAAKWATESYYEVGGRVRQWSQVAKIDCEKKETKRKKMFIDN